MKKLLTFLVMLITLCGISVSADAILIDRGNGMIYDTDLDITWLQDANYAKTSRYDSDGRMTWNEANIWANNLVYGGYSDWRLPTAFNQDGSGPCYGYNCTDSEIGHLYYISLGNVAGGPLTNTWPFTNIPYDTVQLFSFWTTTPSATTSNAAWEFPFSVGFQYSDSISRTYYGWAAHDGDVLAIPGVIQLPQTGQTTCYDTAGAIIPCTGTGQDGDIKAGAPMPTPRFTDNGNGTVTDNLTGLMWIKDANLMYTRDPSFDTTSNIDGAVTWQKALDYVKKLNAESYLGYTDWRLPNINELELLVNAEQSPPLWLEAQGFSNVQSLFYWSSTSDIGNASTAKVLFMAFGETNINDKSYGGSPYNNYGNYVWPVRSGQSQSLGSSIIQLPRTGQTTCYDSAGSMIPCAGTGQDGNIQAGVPWPAPRFTVSADGYCVTDNLTSLMWVKSPDSVLRTWQQALDYANDFTWCGYSDWRLPNRKELYSLIDFSSYNPALLLGHPFIIQGALYWSSTSFASATNFAWSIYIRDGSVWSGSDFYDKSYSGGVWPVRSNRPPILDPIGSKSVNEGALLSFTVSGSDPDGDSLTFSASQLPSGATFDPSTRTFSWTPNYTQAGFYSVTFTVSDGSLTYSETVTITVNDALPPDLIVSSLTAPATAVAGAAIGVSDTTRNQGTGAAGASTTKLYLSTNTTYDAGDIPLGNRPVPSLAPGATDSGTTTVVIPSQICGNTFYIIARADGDGVVIETSETNNNRSLSIKIGPDLNVLALSAPTTSGAGATITISDTTRNSGGCTAGASTTKYYLSTNTSYDSGDVLLAGRPVPSLAAGTTDTGSFNVTIPAGTAVGTYYIIARADADGVVTETNESNNNMSRSIQIGPDLIVSSLSAPTAAGAGTSITISDTTRNSGGGASDISTTRLYLSTDATYDSSDVLLGSRSIPSLAPGATSSVGTSVTIPAGTTSGTYYIIARADADGVVVETSETNNNISRSITIP